MFGSQLKKPSETHLNAGEAGEGSGVERGLFPIPEDSRMLGKHFHAPYAGEYLGRTLGNKMAVRADQRYKAISAVNNRVMHVITSVLDVYGKE